VRNHTVQSTSKAGMVQRDVSQWDV
jgi:hypothetical protein